AVHHSGAVDGRGDRGVLQAGRGGLRRRSCRLRHQRPGADHRRRWRFPEARLPPGGHEAARSARHRRAGVRAGPRRAHRVAVGSRGSALHRDLLQLPDALRALQVRDVQRHGPAQSALSVTTHAGYNAILFVISIAAGVMNALAGGGTVLTFPALLAAGVSPVAANATNAVALVPGSLSAGLGFRGELGTNSGRVLTFLLVASLAGALLGAWLVVLAGDVLFGALVPWLILGATTLFIAQEPLRRWRERRSAGRPGRRLEDINVWGLAGAQFLVAIYGGVFGAGVGILMLAEPGVIGLTNIHQMNGVKKLASLCLNRVPPLSLPTL